MRFPGFLLAIRRLSPLGDAFHTACKSIRLLRPFQARTATLFVAHHTEPVTRLNCFFLVSGRVAGKVELSMAHEQVYDDDRAKRLLGLLRVLAARIKALEALGDLADAGPELIRLMGDARSELFHYEVRCTYDSPELVESRRIVEQAKKSADQLDLPDGNELELEDSEENGPWLE